MIYTIDEPLRDFEFWSGAADRAELLKPSELDTIEELLQDYFGERSPSQTEINDFFWFDFDTICEWLGTTEEELDKRAENDK